jgi:hypothetical protein
MKHAPELTVYGLMAEFDGPEALIEATRRTHEAGYRQIDAYTPFPVHGLAEAMEFSDPRLPWGIFIFGVVGAGAGYLLQYWVSVYAYPHNVGGRPLHSWPTNVPVTFECMILFAALFAVFGMLALNGFPKPYNSVFNASRFDRATQDAFFLAIEAKDEKFDVDETREFLEKLGAISVEVVEP